MHNFIIKFNKLVKEPGWVNALLYAIHYALLKLGWGGMFHYCLVAQPVPKTPLLPSRRGRSIRIECLPPSGLGPEIPLTDADIKARVENGALCLSAYTGDELLGFFWLGFRDHEESAVRCRFRPEPIGATAWDFDLFVRPEHRIGLVFPRLWDEALAELRRRGIKWTVSQISAYNRVSNMSHKRMGAVSVGDVCFLRLGSFQLMVGTVSPYFHISVRPDQIPLIRVWAPRGHQEDTVRATGGA